MDRTFDSTDVAWTGWMYQLSVPSSWAAYMRAGNVDSESGVHQCKTGSFMYSPSGAYSYCHDTDYISQPYRCVNRAHDPDWVSKWKFVAGTSN